MRFSLLSWQWYVQEPKPPNINPNMRHEKLSFELFVSVAKKSKTLQLIVVALGYLPEAEVSPNFWRQNALHKQGPETSDLDITQKVLEGTMQTSDGGSQPTVLLNCDNYELNDIY